MAARTMLVLGGQRSGKSRYAEGIVAGSGLTAVYLATATAQDSEMAARIERHRERRGGAWTLHEEPLELADALLGAARPGCMVLVDCLTLWLTNLFEWRRSVESETERLVEILGRIEGRAVIVSNEVGMGIIPDNALARRFADDLGTLNQKVARAVDEVVLMVAGLPLYLKRAGQP